MSVEQKRNPNDPPIVEPKEFLLKPFKRLEVGEFMKSPNIDLLKWLPEVPNETGLVYQKSRWFIIKAGVVVPPWMMIQNSDILLHSHPHEKGGKQDAEAIPGIGDFLNCSSVAKNFIASRKGITEYWAVNSETRRPLKIALHRNEFTDENKMTEYLQFLKEIGAKFKVYSWEKLDDEKWSLEDSNL